MHSAVHQCAIEAGWRVQSLLRAQIFFTSTSEAIMMFKSQVLSYVESRTAGIAHASTNTLAPLDNVQKHFLRQLGVTLRLRLLWCTDFCLCVPGGAGRGHVGRHSQEQPRPRTSFH